ncbi:MAG: hypothetical protein GYA55_01330 [SAR324 cluster bacterium]|uniref:Uncharacterized protein n=1 Tax=SAR324 cluster bacterium TaxID=2024889 RepID=A0A7X9FQ34_9DELT|nr:hypothetical protein [SAR324 cluster bacterium]
MKGPSVIEAKSIRSRAALPDARLLPRLHKLWIFCFYSLPIDIILFGIGFNLLFLREKGSNFLNPMLLIVLFLSLISLFRQYFIFGIIMLRVVRGRLLFRSTRLVLLILLLIVLAITFIDAYSRHQGKGIEAMLLPSLAALLALAPAWNTIKLRIQRLQRKARNRLIWIEEMDKHQFVFLSLSILSVRAIALFSTFMMQEIWTFGLAWITSLLLILYLEPKESDTSILCRNCLKKTSRSLAGMRYCPACARLTFFSPQTPTKQFQELAAQAKDLRKQVE